MYKLFTTIEGVLKAYRDELLNGNRFSADASVLAEILDESGMAETRREYDRKYAAYYLGC